MNKFFPENQIKNLKVDMSDEGLSNFTPRAQQVLALSRTEAYRLNHNFVDTEHLLLGLIKLGQGVAVNVLQKMGLDLESVRLEVEKLVGAGPDQEVEGDIPYTPRVKRILQLASEGAKELQHTYVGTEHILLGILREGEGMSARVLVNLDVDIDQTRQEILRELDPNFVGDEFKAHGANALGMFGRNLTKEFRRNEVPEPNQPRGPFLWDPVYERGDIIQRVIEILHRRKGNAPILLGKPGVGKTAIIRGLVQQIEHRQTPVFMRDYEIIELKLEWVFQRGTSGFGDIRERIRNLLKEARYGKYILFIEEYHMLFGSFNSSFSQDLWDVVKYVYDNNAEGHPCPWAEFSDVSQMRYHLSPLVVVEEPRPEETLEILKVLYTKYGEFYGVRISNEVMERAVKLSGKYITHTERVFPGKAIDVLDEACSRKRCKIAAPEQEEMELIGKIQEVRERLTQVRLENDRDVTAAIIEQDFEKAAALRDREKEPLRELEVAFDMEKTELSERLENIRENYLRDFTLELKDVDALFPAIKLGKS